APDPTFGDNGSTTTSTGDSFVNVWAPTVDAAHRVIAAIGNDLVRYRADGRIDTDFGNSGVVTIPMMDSDRLGRPAVDSADITVPISAFENYPPRADTYVGRYLADTPAPPPTDITTTSTTVVPPS